MGAVGHLFVQKVSNRSALPLEPCPPCVYRCPMPVSVALVRTAARPATYISEVILRSYECRRATASARFPHTLAGASLSSGRWPVGAGGIDVPAARRRYGGMGAARHFLRGGSARARCGRHETRRSPPPAPRTGCGRASRALDGRHGTPEAGGPVLASRLLSGWGGGAARWTRYALRAHARSRRRAI